MQSIIVSEEQIYMSVLKHWNAIRFKL